jgi:ABC-2 type transport system ATP-binding protein
VVAVQDLNKSYGNVKAVKSLSFSVGRGEVFGILGPNGSGKTSTIETILGTRQADSGKISLLGLDPVKKRREVFRRVGVQFQDSAWQTGIRVGELCETTACLYDPIPKWRESLASFDLVKRIDTPAEALSGGERQKLAILLACIHDPRVIFLDELTTGLDPFARRETWKFIKQLQEQGSSVVLTSHFMDEVETLCQRGLILRSGVKVAAGSITELMEIGKAPRLEDAYINIIQGVSA